MRVGLGRAGLRCEGGSASGSQAAHDFLGDDLLTDDRTEGRIGGREQQQGGRCGLRISQRRMVMVCETCARGEPLQCAVVPVNTRAVEQFSLSMTRTVAVNVPGRW